MFWSILLSFALAGPIDSDGDGLTDEEEISVYQTDPTTPEPFGLLPTPDWQAGTQGSIRVVGAPPSSEVFVLASTRPGSFAVPGCPGTTVPLRAPVLLGRVQTDGLGSGRLDLTAPDHVVGLTGYLDAVVPTQCLVAELDTVLFSDCPVGQDCDTDTGDTGPDEPDCGSPDWSDPDWLDNSGCYYVLDVRDEVFNNWCYRVGSCPSGQPPPGKTLDDMIADHDTLVLVTSLQGLVNRDEAALYLIGETQPDESWLTLLAEEEIWLHESTRHDVASVDELLTLFADHPALQGSVAWDAADPYTLNIAYSLAGARDLLVVRHGGAHFAETTSRFGVVEDLAGRFSSKRSAYTWLISNHLSTGSLSPSMSLYTDGWLVQQMLGGTFDERGQNLLGRDTLVADRSLQISYGVHPNSPDPSQPAAPRGEGRQVLQSVIDAIHAVQGSDVIFRANGWPSSEYSFDCNNDGVVNTTDHVNCEEWEWVKYLSTQGGVLQGGPPGYYAKESANKSFFRHGPGVDLLVPPAPASPTELLDEGIVLGPPRNHSFEQGAAGWVLTATNRATYDDAALAHGGNRFLQANVSASALGTGFHQDIDASIDRGNRYRFTTHARLATAGTQAQLTLEVIDGAQVLCAETVQLDTTTWTPLHCEFQHRDDSTSTARLKVGIDTAGVNVAFDSLYFLGSSTMEVDTGRNFVQFYLGDYDFPMAMQLFPVGVHPFVWNQRHASIPTTTGFTATAAADIPPILAYFAKTRSPNQWFVMPNSGAGYVNPGWLPSVVIDDWVAHSAAAQRPLGYRSGWVLNGARWSDVPASNTDGERIRDMYRIIAPEGITYNATSSSPQTYDSGLPVLPLVGGFFSAGLSPATAAANLTASLQANPTPFTVFRSVFVSEQAIESAVDLARASGTQLDVLDPQTFLYLYRNARGVGVEERLSVVDHTLPDEIAPGATLTADITLRNDGWEAWTPGSTVGGDCDGTTTTGRSCIRIAWSITPDAPTPVGWGRQPVHAYQRSELPAPVFPGDTAVISITWTAPLVPGTHVLQLDGVREGKHYFETVGNVPWQRTVVVAAP